MPTYGYRCTACATTFERIQKITDPPITECVECGAPVKKILYPVGISFKGSGFYVNDYAPKSSDSSRSSASDSEAKAEPKTEAKTETKSETKSETKTETPAAPTTTPAS